MSDAWKSYRGAPGEGTRACALADIPDAGTKCLLLDGFPLLLIHTGDDLRAYVNACPHQFLPLDYKSDRLLSADGAVVRCSNHLAGFSVATGDGVEGLGIGEHLDPVPVHVDNGEVVIG